MNASQWITAVSLAGGGAMALFCAMAFGHAAVEARVDWEERLAKSISITCALATAACWFNLGRMFP